MPKKEYIRQMFDSIAADYDSLNHLMSLGIDRSWRRRALRRILDPSGPQQIMDLACGTGDFAIAIAKAMREDSHVTGVDLSEGMLEVMRKKVEAESLGGRISIMRGEGEGLDFPEGSFDCVSIAFGIRNFEDRERGLREILRVLRPGGRLVILELSVPSNRILRGLYNLYFKHIVPSIGKAVSGDGAAYRYLPASVNSFPGKKEWMQTMSACGFSQVSHKAFSLGICRMYTAVKP